MQALTRDGMRERRDTAATGIGNALRTARILRRKTIEEASRETRIRPNHLVAVEAERFELLPGDVYVRGTLRSYASYVGLDPHRVLRVYTRRFGPPKGMLPPPPGTHDAHDPVVHTGPALFRSSPTWAFLIGVALLVLAVLATLGLLSW